MKFYMEFGLTCYVEADSVEEAEDKIMKAKISADDADITDLDKNYVEEIELYDYELERKEQ